ncbi:hypothetical protein [Flavobacterium davisii]|uniref:hypothetical protein n=1 Tax=Flavobacterium davisii TaxID=2906077 RepID=UPI001F41D7CF|nr:hypothetical protein [Flavobacterium davisii]
MSTIQFIQVSPEQLQNEITKGIKAQLDEFLKRFEPSNPERLLTRDDASKLLKLISQQYLIGKKMED